MEYEILAREMSEERAKAKRFLIDYEDELYSYEFKRESYIINRNEFKIKQKSLPPSPTEAIAVANAQYDSENPIYWWLEAVRIVMRTCSNRKQIFILVRREAEKEAPVKKGKKNWIIYTQRRYSEEIQKRYINDMGWLSERTIKAWLRQLIDRVVEVHLRLLLAKYK